MKATIRNDAPTSRVRSTDAPINRVRNTDAFSIKIRCTDAPTLRTRYSNFGVLTPATLAMNFAGKGYLMGMLGLTYSKIQTSPGIPAMFRSDDVPTARIRNID